MAITSNDIREKLRLVKSAPSLDVDPKTGEQVFRYRVNRRNGLIAFDFATPRTVELAATQEYKGHYESGGAALEDKVYKSLTPHQYTLAQSSQVITMNIYEMADSEFGDYDQEQLGRHIHTLFGATPFGFAKGEKGSLIQETEFTQDGLRPKVFKMETLEHGHRRLFNLPHDWREVFWLLRHPAVASTYDTFYAGRTYSKGVNGCFVLLDPEKDDSYYGLHEDLNESLNELIGLNMNNITRIALAAGFGSSMEIDGAKSLTSNAKNNQAKRELVDKAESDPQNFIEQLVSDSFVNFEVPVRLALRMGYLVKSNSHGYHLTSKLDQSRQSIGFTEDEVVKTLMRDTERYTRLLNALDIGEFFSWASEFLPGQNTALDTLAREEAEEEVRVNKRGRKPSIKNQSPE